MSAIYCEHDWIKWECPDCIRVERDALRAFAQDVMKGRNDRHTLHYLSDLGIAHKLLAPAELRTKDYGDIGIWEETPLLTGESQETGK